MSFRVQPSAMRTYAKDLEDAHRVAQAAKTYLDRWGSFTIHEKGLLGLLSNKHPHFVAQLDKMIEHLGSLTDGSATALKQQAAHYESADLHAESKLDASYPAVPRPPIVPTDVHRGL